MGKYDLAVIGGGLAGLCAAVAASRLGCSVALVQDRSVLGGNSSSEIRVPIGGACHFNGWSRETGILEDLFTEDRVLNPARVWTGHGSSVWDLVLYRAVAEEKNIDLFLDTVAHTVHMNGEQKDRIEKIACHQSGTEKSIEIEALLFVDATGDGTIAYQAGAQFMMGRESSDEFGESLAPKEADPYLQGNSLLFHASDVGFKVDFKAPDWAARFPTDEDLFGRTHDDVSAGYWWIEVGNPPYHPISDNARIRHELLKNLLGVWDHIKNHGDHGADNLAIDWIGMVPGKRESRRIIGDYVLREDDVVQNTPFPDAVAYGGWFIDLHTPGGILTKNEPPEPSFTGKQDEELQRQVPVYSIPFRSLYSKDLSNLMMAGRDISVTHVAFGSTRLMATCALTGQAAGTAAHICKKYRIMPREIYQNNHIRELQQLLIRQDCYIPFVRNEDPADRSLSSTVSASSHARLDFPEGSLGIEYDYPRQRYISLSSLEKERSQTFFVTSERIDAVDLLIESRQTADTPVTLALQKIDHIWEIEDTVILKEVRETVPPNSLSWVRFPLDLAVTPHAIYRISVKSERDVYWRYSHHTPTGTISATRLIDKWIPQKGAYTLRLHPESYPYTPDNISSGVNRPEQWTNLWISDPHAGFPQWVELDLGQETAFNCVILTFDTNLNRTHMATPPFFKAPECVKDYVLYYEDNQAWHILVKGEENYHRRAVHRFHEVSSRKLRLEILSTQGDPSARVYGISVYREECVTIPLS